MSPTRNLVWALAVLAAGTARAAGLTLSVSPQSLDLGEAATLVVSLGGATPRGDPSVTLPDGAGLAGQPQRSQMTQIISGRVSSSIEYTYRLVFTRTGTFVIGPASIATDRGELRSGTAAVVVGRQGTASQVRVFTTIEPALAYVGQPVTATFELAVAQEIRGYELSVPFLAETAGFKLLDPQNLAERWQQAVQRTGRGLPGYDQIAVSGAAGPAVAAVSSRQIEGVPYTVLTVRRVLLPAQAGTRDFGPAVITANVAAGYDRGRGGPFDDPFFGPSPFARTRTKTVTASSGRLRLEVLDPPEAGRPDGFEGAVGRYELSASASPLEVALGGSPMQLTFTVKGEGNIETVGLPRFVGAADLRAGAPEQQAESRFEGDRLVGEKRFIVPLRPGSRHVTEIPAARLVVFNPFEAKYEVLTTDPIPIKVTVPEGTGAIETIAMPPGTREDRRAAEEVKQDIEDIETGFDPAESDGAWLHRPVGLVTFVFMPAGVYATLLVVARRRRMLRDDRTLARKLAAARTARARLEELGAAGASVDAGEFAARLSRILQGYLADRLGRPTGELPPREAQALLCEGGACEACASEAAGILADAEGARFGGGGVERGVWLERVLSCIGRVEGEVRA